MEEIHVMYSEISTAHWHKKYSIYTCMKMCSIMYQKSSVILLLMNISLSTFKFAAHNNV